MVKSFLGAIACSILFVTAGIGQTVQDQNPTQVQTPSPEKRVLIKELLEVMDARKTILALNDSLIAQQEKELSGFVWESVSSLAEVKKLSANEQNELKEHLAKETAQASQRLRQLFKERIDLAQIIEDISYKVYDKYFSENELKDMIAFYQTPTGKKTISLMPALFADSMTETIQAIKPKLEEILREFTVEASERVQKELAASKPKPTPQPAAKRRSRKP